MAGVNPFDQITVSGTREIKPLPHIPGAETSGEIEKIGEHVSSLKKGDRVIVYNRVLMLSILKRFIVVVKDMQTNSLKSLFIAPMIP